MLAPLAANMSPYRFPPCATSGSTLRNDRRAPCRVAATASLGRHRSGKSVTKRLTFSGVTPSRSYRLWRHFPRFCDLLTRALRPYRVPTLRACGEQTRPNGRCLLMRCSWACTPENGTPRLDGKVTFDAFGTSSAPPQAPSSALLRLLFRFLLRFHLSLPFGSSFGTPQDPLRPLLGHLLHPLP